jgi:hypothetical protein
MVINILLIKHLFQKKFGLGSEFMADEVVVFRVHELFELLKDIETFPWIKALLTLFEPLKLEK